MLQRKMVSHAWALLLGFVLFMAPGATGAPLRRPVAVPFGRNYVPTWAFDHIKYYNGGSQIQLYLDKYTGEALTLAREIHVSFHPSPFSLLTSPWVFWK